MARQPADRSSTRPDAVSPASKSDEARDIEVRDIEARDIEAIGRLTEDILPALAAKLAATGLGEIEVRQGAWKIRLRRPEGDPSRLARRASDRPSRAQPGHAGHGHSPAAIEGHRAGRAQATFSTNGSQPADLTPVGPGRTGDPAAERSEQQDDPHRAVATSPAVGVFQPGPTARSGTRVRAGDRLGVVDMLGVPQEVIAPADGVVGATLVETGEAVEYGQELIVLELAGRADRVS